MRVYYEKRAAEYDAGGSASVYKRWFTAAGLAAEVGGSVLHDGPWFVAVRGSSPRS